MNHYAFASTIDDVYIRNNTFSDSCSWTNLETRPMFKVTPSTYCDLATKTQEVVISGNMFIGLADNNIVFSITYTTVYTASKSFIFSENSFTNTRSKLDLFIL